MAANNLSPTAINENGPIYDVTAIVANWLTNWLALTDERALVEYLQKSGLFDAAGIELLLDEGEALATQDPGQALQVTQRCAQMASLLNQPALVAQAHYLAAQCHAIDGAFALALPLIDRAYQAYIGAGNQTAAWRTHVGRVRILGELGRFQEAITLCESTLATLEHHLSTTASDQRDEIAVVRSLLLHNLANCLEGVGQYQRALTAYAVAEEHCRSAGLLMDAAMAHSNHGLILNYLGRAGEALEHFAAAGTIHRDLGATLPFLHTLINQGEAHLLLGDYLQSLRTFEEVRGRLQGIAAAVDEQVNLRQLADLYLALNLHPEALATYQTVNTALAQAGLRYEQGWALWGLGATLMAQGEVESADVALEEALLIFTESENPPLQAALMLEIAALTARTADSATALSIAQRALALVGNDEWPLHQLYAHLRLADLYLLAAQAAQTNVPVAEQTIAVGMPGGITAASDALAHAATHAIAAVQLAERLTVPHLRYRAHQRLGRVYLWQEQRADAERELRIAIDLVESLRTNLLQETLRTSFLQDKLAAYEDLMRLYLAQYLQHEDATLIERAFALAEQARSRVLIERMTGVVTNLVTPQVDSPLTDAQNATVDTTGRTLLALQRDLNAIYNQLLVSDDEGAAIPPTGDSAAGNNRAARLATLHHQALQLERAIQQLKLQSFAQQPGGTQRTIVPHLPTNVFAALLPYLPHQGLLVAYYTLDEEILAFVVGATRDSAEPQLQLVRRVGSVRQLHAQLQQLNAQWARMRADADFVARHTTTLERSAQRVLAHLYAELVAPLEQWLAGNGQQPKPDSVPTLTVIPHGLLHQVPFQALYDGKRYLIDRFDIAYAPSVTAFTLAQSQPPSTGTDVLVMGVADADIPAVQQEVAAVAATYADAHVYLDERATRTQFCDRAPQSRLIHLACHGIFRTDNPIFSAVHLADGWLTAAEIAELQLPGSLVVLSACESGRGGVVGGDEIVGLLRALLGAGAATVVATQWIVQDEATADLMTVWYRAMQGGVAATTALRQAQIQLRQRLPHPYYWAPFIFVGKRASVSGVNQSVYDNQNVFSQ